MAWSRHGRLCGVVAAVCERPSIGESDRASTVIAVPGSAGAPVARVAEVLVGPTALRASSLRPEPVAGTRMRRMLGTTPYQEHGAQPSATAAAATSQTVRRTVETLATRTVGPFVGAGVLVGEAARSNWKHPQPTCTRMQIEDQPSCRLDSLRGGALRHTPTTGPAVSRKHIGNGGRDARRDVEPAACRALPVRCRPMRSGDALETAYSQTGACVSSDRLSAACKLAATSTTRLKRGQ
jgi:hypothetical protein